MLNSLFISKTKFEIFFNLFDGFVRLQGDICFEEIQNKLIDITE